MKRSFAAIQKAEQAFEEQVWYNRHVTHVKNNKRIDPLTRKKADRAAAKIEKQFDKKIKREIAKLEKRFGKEKWREMPADAKRYLMPSLLPKDDYDWGMINGKLSALRWVLDYDWDFLDT